MESGISPRTALEKTRMPHLIVEYSSNIEEAIAIDDLLDKLHAAAAASPVFPVGGIRVRAIRHDRYRIADNHPDNGFVHITARIGHGRSMEVRKQVGEEFFALICGHLKPLFDSTPLGISFEIQELHPELRFKKNNLHDYVKQRNQT